MLGPQWIKQSRKVCAPGNSRVTVANNIVAVLLQKAQLFCQPACSCPCHAHPRSAGCSQRRWCSMPAKMLPSLLAVFRTDHTVRPNRVPPPGAHVRTPSGPPANLLSGAGTRGPPPPITTRLLAGYSLSHPCFSTRTLYGPLSSLCKRLLLLPAC